LSRRATDLQKAKALLAQLAGPKSADAPAKLLR
jgi:hypothetical protein